MTITRKLGFAYGVLATISLVLVAWLGYHEFVLEPAEFARRGLFDIHKDTWPELTNVLFFGLMPVFLLLGWWWMHQVLAPLKALTEALGKVDVENTVAPLPQTMNYDEVDVLTTVFNTMIKRLEESLRRMHAFSLSASHELKTPLTVMQAQLETVLAARKKNDRLTNESTDWIESQLDEVKRLSKIVESLNLISKGDVGLLTMNKERVHLAELIRESVHDAEILAEEQQTQVRLGSCEDLLVDGDRHRLRQLLLILTENAVKYNHTRGRIDVSLVKDGTAAQVKITNTVTETLSPDAEHFFDPFIRGKNAMESTEGCGLGLSIARWIANLHKGSISIFPDSGNTATVLLRLPIAAA